MVNILEKYPGLAERFEELCRTRRDEILQEMVETDEAYDSLRRNRVDTSMALKVVLEEIGKDEMLEVYSDAVYAQESYELDSIYRKALLDAIEALKSQRIL